MSRTRALSPILLSLALACSGAKPSRAFDAASVREISRFDVVDLATVRFKYMAIGDDAHRDADLKALASLEPKVQTLVWLTLFDNGLSVPNDVPTCYIATDRFLSEMTRALREAGAGNPELLRQAELFAAAIPKTAPMTPGIDTGSLHFVTIDPGMGFGPKALIERGILTYVDRNRDVGAWLDGKRRALSDEDRVSALLTMLERIPEFYLAREHDAWPPSYRALIIAEVFEGELSNGGIEQFFSNSSGDEAEATVEALRTVGLLDQASVAAKAIALFPKPYPSERGKRLKMLIGPTEATPLDRALDALTADAMTSQALPVMAAFAATHGILPR